MANLTDARVRSLSEPGRYGDGGGLYLNIAPGGSKSWVQRIAIEGRRRDLGLGGYPAVSLRQARRRASDNRAGVADGRDLLAEKRRPTTPTFREAALRVHEINRPRWRSAKQTRNWIQTLERHAMATLGDIPVDRIGREEVLRVLDPIWTTRPETARRVRQRIRTILRWCMAHGFVEHNVAGETIDGALPPMPQVKEHLRSLPYQEVGEALRIVEASNASLSARLCLRFVILTAARSGEARGASWHEFDLRAREWRILGGRMKAGAEHRVPLSDAALAVLDEARPLRDDSNLVFPSPVAPGRPLSDMTLTKILRATGLADRATVHGFRSSFKVWCMEQTSAPWAVSEAALAHTLGNMTEQAYARSDLFEKRRTLMHQWAHFVTEAERRL